MRIKKEIIQALIVHARKDAPVEACGYLVGRDGLVSQYYELANVNKSREHFSFDPQEQFKVLKDARSRGFEIYGVYHSHPETPARPSPEDIKLAYDPAISYVIVSLSGSKEEVRSFKIKDSKVENEKMEIADDDRL